MGLSLQLDNGWLNLYKMSFWLDCAALCVIYYILIFTGRQINKASIELMDYPPLRRRGTQFELVHRIIGFFYFIFLVLREKIRTEGVSKNLDQIRLALIVVFCPISIILIIVHYGPRRMISMMTGQLHLNWRTESMTKVNKIQVLPSRIRKDIIVNKRKYILYNNIVINIENFKFEHKHKPVLDRYLGQNIFLLFEGKKDAIIGQHLHSAHALGLMKDAAIGKLSHPVENKFPKRSFSDFENYETLTLEDRQMIGDGVYLLSFSSNNFFYFMSTNQELLCTSFSVYHGMNSSHTLESFPNCNRLVNFRLSKKQNNPKLAQFRYFRYSSRNDQTTAFAEYTNTTTVMKEVSEKTSSADVVPETGSNSTKSKCLELYRTKTSKDFEMHYTKTQELSGTRFSWHYGEIYTIVKRKENECLHNYLTYIDNGSTYTAEGPFNIGMRFPLYRTRPLIYEVKHVPDIPGGRKTAILRRYLCRTTRACPRA